MILTESVLAPWQCPHMFPHNDAACHKGGAQTAPRRGEQGTEIRAGSVKHHGTPPPQVPAGPPNTVQSVWMEGKRVAELQEARAALVGQCPCSEDGVEVHGQQHHRQLDGDSQVTWGSRLPIPTAPTHRSPLLTVHIRMANPNQEMPHV